MAVKGLMDSGISYYHGCCRQTAWVVFEGQASRSGGLVGSLLWGVVDCFVKCLLRTVMLSHAILLVSVENQVCLNNLYG